MKYLIILLTTIIISYLAIPRQSYDVQAEFSVTPHVEEVAPLEVTGVSSTASSSSEVVEYKPSTTDALALIPNDEEWKVIASKKHATIIAQIYRGESSFGRHDVCRSRGQYNGFGFMESGTRLATHGAYCFDSFDEVVTHVDNWIEDKAQQGFSLDMMNCYYVRGLKSESCNTAYKLASTK